MAPISYALVLGSRWIQVPKGLIWLQCGVVGHFWNIERIEIDYPLGSRASDRHGGDFCLSGWSGGAFPELDCIKTNNIT
jgi:hypothetical protein